MPDRMPIEVTNLDIYGSPPLEWSRPHDLLAAGPPQPDVPGGDFFTVLGTTRPDGRPHAAALGALWHDGDFYLVSGPGTRKSRNLAANPACTLTVRLQGIDLVFEGEAARVTDRPTLEQLAALYRAGGWPAEAAGDAFTAPYSAPSAGPPPWYLYRLTYHTAFGVAGAEPHGATRWRFAR
jgi:hypothetical protein